jgi:hypothetical protein
MRTLGHLLLIAVSAAVSYYILLYPRESAPALADPPEELALILEPNFESTSDAGEEAAGEGAPPPPAGTDVAPPTATETEPAASRPEPVPPPAEAGDPEGEEIDEAGAEPIPAEEAEPAEAQAEPDGSGATDAAALEKELEQAFSSEELIRKAQQEVTGQTRRGFATGFSTKAGDQLELARFFNEPIVLVPKAGLRRGNEHYYQLRLGPPDEVELVRKAPPLEQYRQYRDLLDKRFSYDALPAPIRELRRRVFVRGDIYLFAALIPPREWGLVIVRREAALGHRPPRGRAGRVQPKPPGTAAHLRRRAQVLDALRAPSRRRLRHSRGQDPVCRWDALGTARALLRRMKDVFDRTDHRARPHVAVRGRLRHHPRAAGGCRGRGGFLPDRRRGQQGGVALRRHRLRGRHGRRLQRPVLPGAKPL